MESNYSYRRVIKYKNGCIKFKRSDLGVDVLTFKNDRIVYAGINQLDLYNDSIINTMIQGYKLKYNLQFLQSDITYITIGKYSFTISGNESFIDIAVSYVGSEVIRDLCFWGNYFCLNNVLSLTTLFLPKQD